MRLDAAFAVCVALATEALFDVVGVKTVELTEPLLIAALVGETPAETAVVPDGTEVKLERLSVTLALAQNC